MIRKIFLPIICLFLLASCTHDPDGYFKRSAGGKLFDTKGFQGSKRRPLYNKKYIERAKRNVVEENYDVDDYYDEDEMEEMIDPARRNRQMYQHMLKRDAARKKRQMFERRRAGYDDYELEDAYPSLATADKKLSKDTKNDDEVQKELNEIKAMLNDARKDLAKYRCPMQQDTSEPAKPKPKPAAAKKTEPSKPKSTATAKQPNLKEKFLSEEDDRSSGNKNPENKAEAMPKSVLYKNVDEEVINTANMNAAPAYNI